MTQILVIILANRVIKRLLEPATCIPVDARKAACNVLHVYCILRLKPTQNRTISIFLKAVLAIGTARFKFFSAMAHESPSMIHGFPYIAHVTGNAMASHESWRDNPWASNQINN